MAKIIKLGRKEKRKKKKKKVTGNKPKRVNFAGISRTLVGLGCTLGRCWNPSGIPGQSLEAEQRQWLRRWCRVHSGKMSFGRQRRG